MVASVSCFIPPTHAQHFTPLRIISRSLADRFCRPSLTLETGCGASTVVFAAQGAHHTAISVDAGEHQRVRAYLREIGLDDRRLTTIVGWSDAVLPTLCAGERTLDAALIARLRLPLHEIRPALEAR